MSDTQLRDEVVTLLIAGHETMATALSWTWYLLMQHPEIYAHMCEEVQHNLAGRTPTLADLPSLPYTLQILKESMRLYPPAWVLLRQATQSVELGKHRLPPGMRVAISPYVLHRRCDYFPDPERFRPERFTPLAEQKLPRLAYLPFGGGPRICIGNHFALTEGHLILATLAQRVTFDLMPGQHIKPEPLTTLRPTPGIKVLVRR